MSDIPGPETPYTPPGTQPNATPADEDGPRRTGRMREQDPDSTVARPETVAEARARQRAQRDREQAEQQALEDARIAAEKRQKRRKAMIGGGVAVGVVGAVALIYAAIPDGNSTPVQTAYCTDQNGAVVSDNYCSTGSFSPVTGFILLNGMSYRYGYGGHVAGNRLVGGTYDRPAGTAFRTQSGNTIDPKKATSFNAGGANNAGSKPSVPTAKSKGTKNIDRGGLGAANHGGSKPKAGSSGS
ncbi:hypothetical protein P0W64_17035 [Tsukamurella sp. 8F]|uniref:hypothetical protein n=1 Tax=unclassified Tsukamurella TaxID=2633480 RepID=UPI0023B88A80|nr:MULTISPECIES: hypothetical protein [unclassified Tsukamurella]MDF0531220.1 hypothetical protein [Tsukamurella sp. 8J]MDF0588489.1 hypothetical protein [Tsukamurella sp. 8F]